MCWRVGSNNKNMWVLSAMWHTAIGWERRLNPTQKLGNQLHGNSWMPQGSQEVHGCRMKLQTRGQKFRGWSSQSEHLVLPYDAPLFHTWLILTTNPLNLWVPCGMLSLATSDVENNLTWQFRKLNLPRVTGSAWLYWPLKWSYKIHWGRSEKVVLKMKI